MMRTLCACLCLPIAFLGWATSSLAEDKKRLLGAPVFDHFTEATYRQVTWEDFRGKGMRPPGWSRWSKGSFAHIATQLRLGKFEWAARQEAGEWLVRAEGIRPYAIMNKDFSAYKSGSKNAYTLAHEQLHFDISEIVARRMAIDMPRLEGRGATAEEAREDLAEKIRQRFEAGLVEHDQLQSRYDHETAHAMNKKKQKKWAAEVEKMFREASEALSAALEAATPN